MSAILQFAMFGLPDVDPLAPRAIFECRRKSRHATGRVKIFTRVLVDGRTAAHCPDCDAVVFGEVIRGTKSLAPCNEACRFATRPDCECSCQGANHARNW